MMHLAKLQKSDLKAIGDLVDDKIADMVAR